MLKKYKKKRTVEEEDAKKQKMQKKYQKKRTVENINKWTYNSILSLGSHSKAGERNNHKAKYVI